MKMDACRIILFSTVVLWSRQQVCFGTNLGDIVQGVKIYTAKDVKLLYNLNLKECIVSCMVQRNCTYFGYTSQFGTTVCGLNTGSGPKPKSQVSRTCSKWSDFIKLYPRVLAGACSDHRCGPKKKCQPRAHAGYRCV